MNSEKDVVIEAASKEEAIKKAERELKVLRSKLQIEVISKGSKGFLGIGKKAVIIRARQNAFFDMEQIINNTLDDNGNDISLDNANSLTSKAYAEKVKVSSGRSSNIDGTITIEDGRVKVANPKELGRFPTISAGKDVEVQVNGKKIDKPTIVHDGDEIVLQKINVVPTATITVKTTDDKMKAHLTIKKKMGKKYEIVDTGASSEVMVFAKCVAEEQPENVNYNEIMNMLKAQGIEYGINVEALLNAINSKEEELKVEVASGLKPSGVEDAYIKYTFLTDVQETQKNPYGEGLIKSVTAGEVLAIKKPPVEGTPGIDITGKPIPPKPANDVEINIKDGVELIKDGTVAVATMSGRPTLEGRGNKFLSILPIYVVNGDINLEVGNIKFKGDIIVNGSVLDGFKLEAGGNIEVFGNVLRAEIYANRNIIVHKKTITSHLQAGGLTISYKQIYTILIGLLSRLESMMQAINVLKKQRAFSITDLEKGEGQLVQLLIDYKFKDVPKTIVTLTNLANQTSKELVTEVLEITQLLTNKLCNLGPLRIKEQKEIDNLLQELQKTVEIVDALISSSADITLNYVQNSVIRTSGDIIIDGQGSITTDLEAGGKIIIQNGMVRGGKLIAREKITVNELGSTSDAVVNVKLLENCELAANIIHPILVIEHGTEKQTIDEDGRYLTAKVSEEGHLVIEKLKAN